MPSDRDLVESWPSPALNPVREPSRVVFCSLAAAFAATFVGHPLDTVKTRLQTYHYPNFWKCITTTYAEGGASEFYRGISASLITASFARAFTMSLYTSFLPKVSNVLGLKNDRAVPVTFFSGLIAGGCCTVLTCPLEFTKVASQVEALVYKARGLPEPKKKGSIQAVRDLSRRGGFKKLYGGYRYHLLRDSIGSAVYFSVYERSKTMLVELFRTGDAPILVGERPNPIAVACSGAMCGMFSWVTVYPIDTMKTSYQRDLYNHSLSSSLEFRETIVQRPKFHISLGMYRGLGFSILRTSINGMVLFSIFEYLLHATTETPWSPWYSGN